MEVETNENKVMDVEMTEEQGMGDETDEEQGMDFDPDEEDHIIVGERNEDDQPPLLDETADVEIDQIQTSPEKEGKGELKKKIFEIYIVENG